MSSLSSNGASSRPVPVSKSQHVRPAPSRAWISPTKMPCIRLRARVGRVGVVGAEAVAALRRRGSAALRGSKMTSSMLHPLEPLVAGQLVDGKDALHRSPAFARRRRRRGRSLSFRRARIRRRRHPATARRTTARSTPRPAPGHRRRCAPARTGGRGRRPASSPRRGTTSSSRQRVTTSQVVRSSVGCSSSKPSKPSWSSTAPARAANRLASSSPVSAGTVMALILMTWDMPAPYLRPAAVRTGDVPRAQVRRARRSRTLGRVDRVAPGHIGPRQVRVVRRGEHRAAAVGRVVGAHPLRAARERGVARRSCRLCAPRRCRRRRGCARRSPARRRAWMSAKSAIGSLSFTKAASASPGWRVREQHPAPQAGWPAR